MPSEFQRQVWSVCSKIPRGRVSTYAAIARAVGSPKAVRAVGNALNKNPFKNVPCHRVVQSSGRVGGFAHGSGAKEKKLRKEGVKIERGKVKDFEKVCCNL